jgi:4-amino-4-deoxy-L-arabinose transferase-like glycosyltransferase
MYFFMITTIVCLFGLIAAGINRKWWWVLGFAAGVIVTITSSVVYGLPQS